MVNPVLGPIGLQGRTETHRSQLMTLYVTRQNQEFVTSRYTQLCDVELVNATVQLVGEPGLNGTGIIPAGFNLLDDKDKVGLGKPNVPGYRNSINLFGSINGVANTTSTNVANITSEVYGIRLPNRISQKPHLNHRFVNVRIDGMREQHQFKQDEIDQSNQLDFVVPTDMGLQQDRASLAVWPPTPLELQRVHLQQRLRVSTEFAGTGPRQNRIGRFVEDWADSASVISHIKSTNTADNTRGPQGEVWYYPEGKTYYNDATTEWVSPRVPSNLITCMVLTFKITPRTQL